MNEIDQFNFFPNPNNGQFFIQLNEGINDIAIYNMNGQMITKYKASSSHNIEIKLMDGTYLLKVYNQRKAQMDIEKILVLK